jgi:hypothetical protein
MESHNGIHANFMTVTHIFDSPTRLLESTRGILLAQSFDPRFEHNAYSLAALLRGSAGRYG